MKCNDGWRWDDENGCEDVNECLAKPKVCQTDQFCVNNEGTHSCLDCDRSCNGCDGDGPDMCKKCADGYSLKDGKCQGEYGNRLLCKALNNKTCIYNVFPCIR